MTKDENKGKLKHDTPEQITMSDGTILYKRMSANGATYYVAQETDRDKFNTVACEMYNGLFFWDGNSFMPLEKQEQIYHTFINLMGSKEPFLCSKLQLYFRELMSIRIQQTRLLKQEIEILKSDAEDKTQRLAENEKLLAENEKKIDALEITIRIKDDKLKAAGKDMMATVPQCLDWLEDEYTCVPNMPRFIRETLRKKVQKYLKDNNCERVCIGGKMGDYYYIADLAIAFQKEYGHYSVVGFQGEFSEFAKYKTELSKG